MNLFVSIKLGILVGSASILFFALAACGDETKGTSGPSGGSESSSSSSGSSSGAGGAGMGGAGMGGSGTGGVGTGGSGTGGSGTGGAGGGSPGAKLCTDTGGTITTALCCMAVGDFPNLCLDGACGCAPGSSHDVQTCMCPVGKCFDGTGCVVGP